jgi:hypothetical protein
MTSWTRTPAILACAVCLTGLGVELIRQATAQRVVLDGRSYYLLADDAMISARYAYNLAHGRGLSWNAGDRVEGITNLGWTIVMAVPHWLGIPLGIAPLFPLLVNALLMVALCALVLIWSWCRGRAVQGMTAATLIAFDPTTITWGAAGMETTLQTMLVTLAVLPFFFERAALSPLWAGLAFVIRPDSLLVFFWTCVLTIWRRCRLWPLVVGAAVIAAVFVFQRVYYGDWLPNTYYLKATAGAGTIARGLRYLATYALSWPFLGWPLLAAPIVYVAWRRRLVEVAALPVLWAVYVVWIGGDAFPAGRFFAPIVPTMALFAGALLDDLCQRECWPALAVAALCLYVRVAAGALLLLIGTHVWVVASYKDAVNLAKLGREHVPRSATIGVYYAGVLPYYMPEHRFHDFLGKSDRVIARSTAHSGPPGHNKWNYRYSLDVIRPDFIVTAGPFDGTDDDNRRLLSNDYAFHPALWLDPTFRAKYRRVAVPAASHWIYARTGD